MAAQNFVLANKTKLSIATLDDAFLAGYDPAAPAPPAALTPLIGGTSADENIGANNTESVTFGDDAAFANGLVTSQTWSISYSFNILPSDAGYQELANAALNATDTFLWIRKEDPLATGGTTARSIAGIVSVTDWSTTAPSDGILSGSCTLTGRGKPVITPAA
jgi:hypothetical protein